MQNRQSIIITTPEGRRTRGIRLTVAHSGNGRTALVKVLAEGRTVRVAV